MLRLIDGRQCVGAYGVDRLNHFESVTRDCTCFIAQPFRIRGLNQHRYLRA